MTTLSPTLQRIAISLSREELYVVMRLLKATQLPGFDLSWLNAAADGTVPDDVRHALEVATNALVARGYLTPQEPTAEEPLKVNMPSPVIALVGTCAFGIDSILLSLHTADGPRLMYLHELRELAVAHTMPVPDIHQFEAIEGRAGMLHVIEEMLDLRSQTATTLPAGKVPAVDVQAARDAALAGKMEEAVELLVRGGLPAITAEALCRAMKESTALGAISIGKRDAGGQPQDVTLALVISPTLCFALADADVHPAAFHVQPTSAEALKQWIASSLPQGA